MFTRRFVRIRVVAIAPFGFLFMCMRSCWCVRACVSGIAFAPSSCRGSTGTSRRRIGPRREGVACLPSVPQAGVWIAGVVLRSGGRRRTVVLARRRQTDPAVATPRRNERTDPSAHGYTRHGVLPSNRTRAPRRTAARKHQPKEGHPHALPWPLAESHRTAWVGCGIEAKRSHRVLSRDVRCAVGRNPIGPGRRLRPFESTHEKNQEDDPDRANPNHRRHRNKRAHNRNLVVWIAFCICYVS